MLSFNFSREYIVRLQLLFMYLVPFLSNISTSNSILISTGEGYLSCFSLRLIRQASFHHGVILSPMVLLEHPLPSAGFSANQPRRDQPHKGHQDLSNQARLTSQNVLQHLHWRNSVMTATLTLEVPGPGLLLVPFAGSPKPARQGNVTSVSQQPHYWHLWILSCCVE